MIDLQGLHRGAVIVAAPRVFFVHELKGVETMSNAITVKTMEKDKDGKPIEQVVLVRHVAGVQAVPAVPEVKAAAAVPATPATEGKPAVEAAPAQPETAIIKFESGQTLHVAMTAKEVAGLLE